MYDFNFLREPVTQNTSLIVYGYNSGIWRRRVLEKLNEREGQPLSPAMPNELPELLAGNSLFGEGPRIVCDLGDKLDKNSQNALDAILADLVRDSPRVAALMISEANPLQDSHQWRQIIKDALILMEPAVTAGTIGPLLQFLAQTTDLTPSLACVNQRGFVRCFADLQDSKDTLPELIHRFDILLGSSDPETNLVNIEEAILESSHQVALSGFDDLLEQGGERQVATFIASITRAIRGGYSAEVLMRAVVSRTGRVLRSAHSASRPAGRESKVLRSIVLAGLVLAAWRDLLPTSPLARETIVSRWDALLRAFVVRTNQYDPLEGVWERLNDVVARSSRSDVKIPSALRRLVDAALAASADIPEELRPDWVKRLRQNLRRPLVPERLRRPRPRLYVGRPFTSFDEVIGQSGAVRTLKSLLPRYRVPSDGTRGNGHPPLLVWGPDGVGKTALARLFAKAVLCEGPIGGSPCNNCSSCQSFEDGSTIGYEPMIDATREDLEEKLARHVAGATQPHLASRSIVTIDQADQCDQSALDVLLKTLEQHVPRIVYVFLASSDRGVGAALRSRSIEIELRRLGARDAMALLSTQLTAATSLTEHLAALVAAGEGLPGRLFTLLDGMLASQVDLKKPDAKIDSSAFLSPSRGGIFLTKERRGDTASVAARDLVMRYEALASDQYLEWDRAAMRFLARGR